MNKPNDFCNNFKSKPVAFAFIKGSEKHPGINGKVMFYVATDGVMVHAEIKGLPRINKACDNPIYAFHIHTGTSCSGNETDAFANTGTHFNPGACAHPQHAGDLPPLFSANGNAYLSFITNRFTIPEILGKSVVIHSSPDDFTTQPSGNAVEKIACGIIRPLT